ncbi:hypothetical protein [Sorangium sp. So ce1335]|uniref:hypothetical protein n=1 Tax=Sorangium sp. So ce1335 TaxID=3133335 RepID=UPI003F5E19DB
MGDENPTRCERCDMRAPAGKKHCAACAQALGVEADGGRSGPARQPLGCRQYLALALLGGLVAWTIAVLVIKNEQRPVARPSTVAAQPKPAHPADLEADDVVRVLRALYPIGQAVGGADWDWSTCHDKTVGFDALLSCAKEAHTKIRAQQAKMPTGTIASSACGKDIEQAHRAYIDGQERYHADVVAWLEQHRAALTPALRRRSLPDGACDAARKACDAMPIDVASKYGAEHGASYARVNTIECTKQLFVCGSTDNVCYIGKVADRLGLGSDGTPRDGLLVRSTGRRLR